MTANPSDYKGWQKELSAAVRTVEELYDRYAQWCENWMPTSSVLEEQDWPRLHGAITRQKEIGTIFRQFAAQQ